MPEPQTAIPRSASPAATARARRSAELRIIDAFGTIGAKVAHVMSLLAEPMGELVLQEIAGMIGGEGDAHPGTLACHEAARHWAVCALRIFLALT